MSPVTATNVDIRSMPLDNNANPILDEKWLNRAAWWVRNRGRLARVALVVFFVISGGMILYSFYGWADYWFIGRAEEQRLFQELTRSTNYTALHANLRPADIQPSVAVVLPGSGQDGRWDVLVKFVNQNPKWLAAITYRASTPDGTTPETSTISLLNSEERFVLVPALALSPGANVQVEITDVRWTRLREPETLNKRKPTFTVREVRFISPAELRLSGDTGVSQVNFVATNESTYGFWAVDFMVVLMQGDRAVAAQATTLDKFAIGEERSVSLNMYTAIPTVTSVLVIPRVDVSRDSAFMNQPGEPIRF